MTTNTKRIRVNESDVVCVVTMPNNTSSSSLHAADKIGSCDDLITEIMLRLPVISLIRFKSVSKRWSSLISNPTLTKLFQNRTPDPPSGLYAVTKTNTQKRDHYFISFDVENRSKAPDLILNFDPDDRGTTHIVHSCNGLMLCCCQYWNDYKKAYRVANCYVYNPTINQFTRLPKHKRFNTYYKCGMTLAFDPSKSPYYKIVSVCRDGMDHDLIGIYNSQTRTWKASCGFDLAYGDCFSHVHSGHGVYWNNVVHWFVRNHYFLYFNLDEEVVRSLDDNCFRFASTDNIFESRDHLLLVERDSLVNWKVKIHELKRDYSGWFVKYHVDFHQLDRSFPKVVNPYSGCIRFLVVSVVLGERDDESFFVLAIAGVAVRFNLVAETFYKLHDFDASYINGNEVFLQNPFSWQFIASICSV